MAIKLFGRLKWPYNTATIALIVACSVDYDNPLDSRSRQYQPPHFRVDSLINIQNDSTVSDTVKVIITPNRPELFIRHSLDTLSWSGWKKDNSIVVPTSVIGEHTIMLESRYGEGGEEFDTTINFCKAEIPTIVAGPFVNGQSTQNFSIRAQSACTLTLSATGTFPLSYQWRRGGNAIDTLDTNLLKIPRSSAADSGVYYCVVSNRWGTDTSIRIRLSYIPPNPVAVQDTYSTVEDSAIALDVSRGVLANDTDIAGGTLTASLLKDVRHGTLTFTNYGSFSYIPGHDFFGVDTFIYQTISAEKLSSDSMHVYIIIKPVNDLPIVKRRQMKGELLEGDSMVLNDTFLLVQDVDNTAEEIKFTLTSAPLHGILHSGGKEIKKGGIFSQCDVDSGKIMYVHSGDEESIDRFVLGYDDGSGMVKDSLPFVFTILPVNDTPHVGPFGIFTVIRRLSATFNASTFTSISDPDNSELALKVYLMAPPRHGEVRQSGTVINAGNYFTVYDMTRNLMTYYHDGSEAPLDTFAFKVDDGNGGVTPIYFFSFFIDPGKPRISSIAATTSEDSIFINDTILFTVNYSDTNGAVNYISIDSGSGTFGPYRKVTSSTQYVFKRVFAISEAGSKIIRAIVKDDDSVASDTSRDTLKVSLGAPTVSSIVVDTARDSIFVNDVRKYKTHVSDPNGSIKKLYASWNDDTIADTSMDVSFLRNGVGDFVHAFPDSGLKRMFFWIQDEDGVFSPKKKDSVFVRLAAPVLWGDNPTKDTLWLVINNGYGISYNVHVNSKDSNGIIGRYYWSEAGVFDSSTATKTTDPLYSRLVGINDVNKGFPMWIYGRDDDQLIGGGKFIVYADSAPPAPDIVAANGDGGVKIMWSGKDVKDSNATLYRILLKQGSSPTNTDILQDFKAGTLYSAGDAGYQFKFPYIGGTIGLSYKYKVIAKDARGSETISVEGTFIYP